MKSGIKAPKRNPKQAQSTAIAPAGTPIAKIAYIDVIPPSITAKSAVNPNRSANNPKTNAPDKSNAPASMTRPA